MNYYAVAELTVTDPSWVKEYMTTVTPMVEKAGGRYLCRTPKVEVIEGEKQPPQSFVIIEFPSREAAAAFYDSEEYELSTVEHLLRSPASLAFLLEAAPPACERWRKLCESPV